MEIRMSYSIALSFMKIIYLLDMQPFEYDLENHVICSTTLNKTCKYSGHISEHI